MNSVYDGAANKMLDIAAVETFAELLLTDGKIGPESVLQTNPGQGGKPDSSIPASGARPASDASAASDVDAGSDSKSGNASKTGAKVMAEGAKAATLAASLKRSTVASKSTGSPDKSGSTTSPKTATTQALASTNQKSPSTGQSLNNLTGDQKVKMFEDFIKYVECLKPSPAVLDAQERARSQVIDLSTPVWDASEPALAQGANTPSAPGPASSPGSIQSTMCSMDASSK